MMNVKKVYARLSNPRRTFRAVAEMRTRARRYMQMREIFIEQPYMWLFKGLRPKTTVLDIGANIGDTAIYACMFSNADRVIAYEPMPLLYNEAKRNIKKSPFSKKIKLINMAVTRHGDKTISGTFSDEGASSYKNAKEHSHGIYVKGITLAQALRGMRNVVIKCDIEGEEAEIFKGADLRNVYKIQIEYHDTKDELLMLLKEKGFKVSAEKSDVEPLDFKEVGYVYATR